jgi:hypothetical protein
MPRGVLDVNRGSRASGALASTQRNALVVALSVFTVVFVVGCVVIHELVVHGHPGAFALFPAIGMGYLAACIPLGVLWANPEDAPEGCNVLKPKDFMSLCARTYGAFARSKSGKIEGKDL